jgi:hypothetical protein
MNLSAINDDPDLHHTPFGRVTVSRGPAGGAPLVSIEHEQTGTPMVIGLLRDDAGVFDGLHGKRQWEAWHVLEKAERQRLQAESRAELSLEDQRIDFRRELNAALAAKVDGRDLLISAMSRFRKRGPR